MTKRVIAALIVVLALVLTTALAASAAGPTSLSDEEQLGKNLFFDTNLSDPP